MTNYDPPTSRLIGPIESFKYKLARMSSRFRLSDLDQRILGTIRDNLSRQAAEVLSDQLRFCNFFPHYYGRQTMEFLRFQGRALVLPTSDMCFRCTLQGIPLASVTVAPKHGGGCSRSLRVDLSLSQGRLYHMSYAQRPKKVFQTSRLSTEEFYVADVDVLFDPMVDDAFTALETDDRGRLPKWLVDVLPVDKPITMLASLKSHERARIIDHYGLAFPSDYLELVESIEYLRCANAFEILGPSRIWSFLTPQEYLVVLADSGYGYICLRRDATPGLCFFGHSDLMPVPLPNSFQQALERAIVEEIEE